jgi:RHS repeat-associated protein
MEMPGRKYDEGEYRFAFNGKESINEFVQNSTFDFGSRYYDPRIGMFLGIDPLFRKYCFQSPYSAFNLNPLIFVDPTGMGGDFYAYYSKNSQTGKTELIISDYIDNGDKAPNRLFILDPNATSATNYRIEHDGGYYQVEMIPTDWYSEEELRAFSATGEGRSIYDRDRFEYIYNSGDYSDKNLLERWWQDLNDNDFINQGGLELLITRVFRVSEIYGGKVNRRAGIAQIRKDVESQKELQKHIGDQKTGVERMKNLQKKLDSTTGKKQRDLINKELENERKKFTGHNKEMRQKWNVEVDIKTGEVVEIKK